MAGFESGIKIVLLSGLKMNCMAYKVTFVINGRDATLDEEFTHERDAREAAAGIEQEGYPTEVVDTTPL